MIDVLKKINGILNSKQKKSLVFLFLLILIGGGLEVFSISMIIPVVSLVISQDALESSPILLGICNFLHIDNIKTLTIITILLMLFAFLLKGLFMFKQKSLLYKFSLDNQYITMRRLMKSFLDRDYEYFLHVNSSVIIRTINTDVYNTFNLILAMLQFLAAAVVAIMMFLFLAIIDWQITAVVVIALGIVVGGIKFVFNPILLKASKSEQYHSAKMIKWISQAITGIKEVIVMGRKDFFVEKFSEHGKIHAEMEKRRNLINCIPAIVLEMTMMTGVLGYLLFLVLAGEDIVEKLPVISAFAMAVVKLLPTASSMIEQTNHITFYLPYFLNVNENLMQDTYDKKGNIQCTSGKIRFNHEIYMKNITYCYPETEKLIFDKAELKINKGESIGIVGSSGAGKTTIVDILLGILKLKEGEVLVDGKNINDNPEDWLKNIGYIPQSIFMLDGSIRDNVVFGSEDISDEKVWKALREAQLEEYVKELPDGLDSEIGERGIRMSGGQRQRLGIARALYNDPDILILDEATSALDTETEKAIMESVNYLQGYKTLIIIAHRLQTIENCDKVYRVEDGKIVECK